MINHMNTTTKLNIRQLSKTFGKEIYNNTNDSILSLDDKLVTKSFESEGVILFRGFNTDFELFTKFSNKFSDNFMDYTGGIFKRRVINGNPTVLTVNDFNHEIKLHGEMYYQKNIPLMLWFFCAHPASDDGETIICDGKQFYNELSDSLKELFSRKKLKFVGHNTKEAWTKRYKTNNLNSLKRIFESNDVGLHINEDESIDTHYICPVVHPSKSGNNLVFINSLLPAICMYPNSVTFDDDSEIDDEVMAQLNNIAEKLAVKIEWQKGDILMIDNTRVMHGRRAFLDDSRDIYLRLCSPSF